MYLNDCISLFDFLRSSIYCNQISFSFTSEWWRWGNRKWDVPEERYFIIYCLLILWGNLISGVMVSVLASSGVEPQLGQTKDYEIGIYCFSAKHAALRSRSKNWLARNQNNVSEWNDMSTRRLLFQWASTKKNN
jgi:hypothetical protein